MRKSIAIATIGAALALLHPIFNSTNAMFGETFAQQSNQFAGATFSPTVAPVVSVTPSANSISLSWSRVTISSSAVVSFEVLRLSAGVSPVAVCTGVDMPTLTGNTIGCNDATAVPGVSYTYTEMPIVMSGSTATWSLTASAPSAAICLRRCR